MGLRHIHAAVFGFELVERRRTEAMLAAHLCCRHPSLLLLNRKPVWKNRTTSLGENDREIQGWISELEAGAARLWTPEIGAYDALNIRTGNFTGSVSSAALLCWYGGLKNPAMLSEFDRIVDTVTYAMPSHDPHSDLFEPYRYWRGPVWGIIDTLIAYGLSDLGNVSRAERLRADTAALITKSGFAEYFNPEDGSLAGGKDFTWTAAIWLAWASPSAQIDGS